MSESVRQKPVLDPPDATRANDLQQRDTGQHNMDPISILITLVIIGFVLWLVQKLPINDTIKQIIIGIVILFIIIDLIRVLAPMAHGLHF